MTTRASTQLVNRTGWVSVTKLWVVMIDWRAQMDSCKRAEVWGRPKLVTSRISSTTITSTTSSSTIRARRRLHSTWRRRISLWVCRMAACRPPLWILIQIALSTKRWGKVSNSSRSDRRGCTSQLEYRLASHRLASKRDQKSRLNSSDPIHWQTGKMSTRSRGKFNRRQFSHHKLVQFWIRNYKTLPAEYIISGKKDSG